MERCNANLTGLLKQKNWKESIMSLFTQILDKLGLMNTWLHKEV
jgi:hypothetical protein